MNRDEAAKYAKEKMLEHGLNQWHLRFVSGGNSYRFLGKCDYKNHTLFINSHHVNIHPTEEVRNTILHEIAHALCPGCAHNDTWKEKAREIGCDNTSECATYSLDAAAIDAIRSGDSIEITFDEQVILIK